MHDSTPQHETPDAADAPQPRPRTVYMETFGCQMNVLDSQLVRGQLQGLGYTFVDDWKQADVVLYNTCSVREQAENKAYSRLGLVGIRKKKYPHIVLGVIGCMAERDGVDMFRRYPQVDLLCGPGELDKVPLLIDNVVRTRQSQADELQVAATPSIRTALQGNTHRRSSTLAAAEDQLEMLDLARSFSPDEHQGSAYVRITRGCNKFCTYCVVPNTRGREIHRPPEALIDECKRLVDAGVIEITLLGQTVNHYQFDHAASVMVNGIEQPQVGEIVSPATRSSKLETRNSVTTFAQLLARIHDEVPALQRLRFVTSFPRDFGDDILHTIAERPRLCRYLHLPVQSGSNRIRTILPDATIASDLICGFPGETDDDHRATCELLREARFKNCFIFKYSPRPGTTAYDRLPDDVPDEVKRARNNELLRIQGRNSDELHRAYVGRTVRVFVESVSVKSQKQRNAASRGDGAPGAPGGQTVSLGWEKAVETTQLCGRTDGDLIVMFDGDESLIGSIVEVRIEKHAPLALFGGLESALVSG